MEQLALAAETDRKPVKGSISITMTRSAWGMLVFVLLVSLVTLWPSWTALADAWINRAAYSHGFLIAVICVGLILRLRPGFAAEIPDPQIAGILLLTALLIIWLFMRFAGIQIIELLLLPAVVWAACFTVMGWRVSARLLFPFGFLYFAIPVWHSGNFILQWLTVQAVERMISAAGFLAYIDGNFVFLSSGAFEIADGCSGLNFFIVGTAISMLYGYLYLPDLRRRTILLLAGVLMAIVMNWVRVFIIIYAGYLTDMQHYLVKVDHTNFGWALFALLLVPLVMIARRLEGKAESSDYSSIRSNHVNADLAAYKTSTSLAFVGTAALMITASIFGMIQNGSSQLSCEPIRIPQQSGDWRLVDKLENDWSPVFAGAADEAMRHYENGRHVVTLYMNIYSEQSEGSELIGYENHIEGAGKWKHSGSARKKIYLDEGVVWDVSETILKSDEGERRIIYYWYIVGGHKAVDDLTAKLWQGYSRLAGNSQAGIMAISSLCTNDDCAGARAGLQQWLNNEWAKNNKALMLWAGDCSKKS